MNIYLSLVNLAHAVTVDVGFGSPSGGTGENIANYIKNIYIYGVSIAGILAVGVIVFGAIYYAVSGGNPDKQRDARSYITSALWGLALLLGSYLILNTINPQITTLSTLQNAGCKEGDDPKETGCIPQAPFTKPACTGKPIIVTKSDGSTTTVAEKPGENCTPACKPEEIDKACLIGQTAKDNGCVECFPIPQKCPDVKFAGKSCSPYLEIYNLQGPEWVPDCGETPASIAVRSSGAGQIAPRDCSLGSDKDKFNNAKTVDFSNGAARIGPYYPSGLGVSAAQCVIYQYIKEVPTNTSTIPWENAKLKGFKNCK